MREDDPIDLLGPMVNAVFLVAAVVVLAPTLQRILGATPAARMYAAQAYQGVADPRVLEATDELQWLDLIHERPYVPWISAFFVNQGPDDVEVGIYYPADRFILHPNATITVNRAFAQERIAVIFYICRQGQRATVEVIGEY